MQSASNFNTNTSMSRKASVSDWAMLILLALIWGSSFILMKKGLEAFNPVQVAALRILITGLVMIPFLITRWKQVPKHSIGYILLQGLFGNFLPAFLFTLAQQHINSSLAGILNSLSPVFVLLLGILFFGTGFTRWRITGMLIAFSGSLLLLLLRNGGGITTNGLYAWLVVLATLSYGISSNIIKKYLHAVTPVTINAVAFAFMLLPACLILYTTHPAEVLATSSVAYASLGFIALLAVFGSGLASIIYFKLIHNTTALFAASVTYLIPVVALGWGLLAGEPIGIVDFAGMALILSGVYLIGK